jgi:hypothetical protein
LEEGTFLGTKLTGYQYPRAAAALRRLTRQFCADEPPEPTGVRDRVFGRKQQDQILALRLEPVCLNSTAVAVHPEGPDPLITGPQVLGRLHRRDSSVSATPGAES